MKARGKVMVAGLIALGMTMPAGMAADTNRLVCLGDSITDGYTFGQIVMQSLREAGRPAPAVICAGVGSDTASMMVARLDRTVLVFAPRWVVFSAGANDALRGVTPADYETALRAIVARVTEQGGRMVLMTPCVLTHREGATPAAREAHGQTVAARLDAYEAIIRRVATEPNVVIAEVRREMLKAMAAGESVLVDDGVHPNFRGQSCMARALMDAMGWGDVPLPKTFAPHLFPGVVREWTIRRAPLDGRGQPIRLTPETVGLLKPDATWHPYKVPDRIPAGAPPAEEWTEQIRRNGFALQMSVVAGGKPIQAVADLEASESRQAWIQAGGDIAAIWLNGAKLHDQGQAWTGFHAGKERLPVTLASGRNRLVIEAAGQHVFLAVTDKRVWEEP